jgi:hypothetical protein
MAPASGRIVFIALLWVTYVETKGSQSDQDANQPPPTDSTQPKLEDWPTGTEVHDPSVMTRFEGLAIVEEGARTTGGLPR